jgi:AraC-like DNA-binding protein
MSDYEKTGYLESNFRIFHLLDEHMKPVDFHFHDFHKILYFQRGNVDYQIEGRSYKLSPNDIVFVPAGEVHRPILHDNSPYERIIIYISQSFLDSYKDEQADLSLCLLKAHENHSHVLRVPAFESSQLGQIMQRLVQSFSSDEYANELYHHVLFIEFMIQLNRAALRDGIEYIPTSSSNGKILTILNYLNENLAEDITIESLTEKFCISRYYLMHTFKEETGYSVGSYLSTKRLLLARDLITEGVPLTTACYECGFKNYSTFSRAYHKLFGHTPREHLIRPSASPENLTAL